MEVAAFVISIFALVFALIGMGLAMRALYILGVNAGLDKQFEDVAYFEPFYLKDFVVTPQKKNLQS